MIYKSTFPKQTKEMKYQDARREMAEFIKSDACICGCIFHYIKGKSYIRDCFNTERLEYPYFHLAHFKSMAYNSMYKLFDQEYSKVGLDMVIAGKDEITDYVFCVEMPAILFSGKAVRIRRKTLVRRLNDNGKVFDALLIYFEIMSDFSEHETIDFLPRFTNANNELLLDATKELHVRACFHIIENNNFPIRGIGVDSRDLNISIYELIADGKSDEEIAAILNIAKAKVTARKKDIANMCRKFLPKDFSYKLIAQYFRRCKIF